MAHQMMRWGTVLGFVPAADWELEVWRSGSLPVSGIDFYFVESRLINPCEKERGILELIREAPGSEDCAFLFGSR